MHRIVKNTPPNSLLQPPLLLKHVFSSFPKKPTSPILVTRGDFASSKVSRRPLLQNEVTVFTPGTLCGKAHATLVILLNLPCQMEPQKQETYVLLTHRAPNMRNHSNEISMPGGAVEPGESAESAALREVEEEIGLQRQHLELFGSLPSFFLRKMKGTVTPSVAFFTGDYQQLASNLRAQIDEVQGIFVVPLRELVASTHFTAFRIPDKFKDGMPMFYRMPVFLIDEFKVLSPSLNQRYLPKHRLIWGLTAITLHETLLAFALLPN